MLSSSSPKLFAGIRVLHRLLMPRHPPAALNSLTKKFDYKLSIELRFADIAVCVFAGIAACAYISIATYISPIIV